MWGVGKLSIPRCNKTLPVDRPTCNESVVDCAIISGIMSYRDKLLNRGGKGNA